MDHTTGRMGVFAGKLGKASAAAKICPACHRPIYANQSFCALLDTPTYYHAECFYEAFPTTCGNE